LSSFQTKRFAPFLIALWVFFFAGGVAGLGAYTFYFGRGFSYFQESPEACVNCHVMKRVYDGWNHGTHKGVATCNDCHTPRHLVSKYFTKAVNGWNHSVAFTTGNFSDPIRITPFNRTIARNQCLFCHETLVTGIVTSHASQKLDCLRCHKGVGHAS